MGEIHDNSHSHSHSNDNIISNDNGKCGGFHIPEFPQWLEMVKVRQVFKDTASFNFKDALRREAGGEVQSLLGQLEPGATVGIAVGSRGIADLDKVVKAVAELVQEVGGVPSVFSAMGGHGGTEEGQLGILAGLGITSKTMGIPVVASSQCQQIGTVTYRGGGDDGDASVNSNTDDKDREKSAGTDGAEDTAGYGGGIENAGAGDNRDSSGDGADDVGVYSDGAGAEDTAGYGDGIEMPVFVNSLALDFDWIIPVNRVKSHTSFTGEIESGLTKMMAVGIGGSPGAKVVHSHGAKAIGEIVEQMGPRVAGHLPILMGVALVEDKTHNLKTLRLCSAENFGKVDRELLQEARRELPLLPFEEIDVLIVNQMGKGFSGTGMDSNVIGRIGIRGVPDKGLKAKYIVVLDLDDASGGNANGIGLADITTAGLVKKIDYPLTLKNVLTTSFLDRAKIPVVFANDREAIAVAIGLASHSSTELEKETEKLRIVQIENTLELEEFYVSAALADAVGTQIVSRGHRMAFDHQGKFVGY